MGKQLRQFTVRTERIDSDNFSRSQVTLTPVDTHTITALVLSLENAITTNNETAFQNLLSSDFIYPGDGFQPCVRNLDYETVCRGSSVTITSQYRYYETQPLIEALFLEYNLLFRKLTSLLAASANSNLHKIFVTCFRKNTELPSDILSPCDNAFKQQLYNGVHGIYIHGAMLQADGVLRGSYAKQFATELRKDIDRFNLTDRDPHTNAVRSLQFKFDFLKKLREHFMKFDNFI